MCEEDELKGVVGASYKIYFIRILDNLMQDPGNSRSIIIMYNAIDISIFQVTPLK